MDRKYLCRAWNKGDKDKAFAELVRSISAGDWDMHRLNFEPLMDPLRGDTRFEVMVPPLAAGLFAGDYQRFVDVVEEYQKILANRHYW